MPALALPSPVPSLWGGRRGEGPAGLDAAKSACTLPHQTLSIGSFPGGRLAEPAQPVRTRSERRISATASGVRAASSSSPAAVARVREEREAEEELVDGEQRGGDEAGRLGEGDLQVLAAAQGLQQGAEVAGRLERLVFGLRGGACGRGRRRRGPCSARRGRASAPRARPGERPGTAGRGSAAAGRRWCPAARGGVCSSVGRGRGCSRDSVRASPRSRTGGRGRGSRPG